MKSYNANKPTSYITYLDVNSLYGQSIMQFLQTETHDWANLKDSNLENFDYNVLVLILSTIYNSIDFFYILIL